MFSEADSASSCARGPDELVEIVGTFSRASHHSGVPLSERGAYDCRDRICVSRGIFFGFRLDHDSDEWLGP
jgi:hypothetical protein